MNIDELGSAIAAARLKAAGLDIGTPEWFEVTLTEVSLAARARHLLVNDPVVTTNDSVVKKILSTIDPAECDDPHRRGLELLSELVRPEEYFASLAEIMLILPDGTKISEHLRSFFGEARQCYALGQFAAVQCLCRTILETTVNEIGVLNGEWTKKQLPTSRFLKAYPFPERVRLVAGSASDKIYELYRDLCSVVHGENISAKNGAPLALVLTVNYVQHLYALHKQNK